MRKALLLFTVLLAAGCVSQYAGNEDSPYYVVPAGSILTLNRELTFGPEEVGVYFQKGQQVGKSQIDLYRPHCKLELNDRLGAEQRVVPDEFLVTRGTQEVIHSVSLPVMLASGNVRLYFGGLIGRDSPSPELYATRLILRNTRQPHVRSLVCGRLESPPVDAVHLSIRQIRDALGTVFTLQVASPGGRG